MKNLVKIVVSIVLTIGCLNFVKSQECITCGNPIGENSSAVGSFTESSGMSSVTIGYGSQSIGDCAVTIGTFLTTNNNSAITIGYGQNRDKELENTTNGIMMGCYSTKPTLYISKSPGHSIATGKVGIGNNTNLQAKLHIKADGGIFGYEEDADIMLEPTSLTKKAAIYFKSTDNYISMLANSDIMSFSAGGFTFNSGKVGIGCNNDVEGFSLAVKDGIITEKVVIKAETEWPDFVFGKDYNLISLPELKKFVAENKHLPNVPSEAEVNENGVSVGEMQSVLLQKIEELTLYTIQQQEMIDQLKKEIEELKSK